jgi:orotate phosphoribosyltransferase
MAIINNYKQKFIQLALAQKALCFGEFSLKSGRISPYFFNAGLFSSGFALGQLGEFYASAIQDSKIDFTMLFGPAYKGIPLVSSTAIALARNTKNTHTDIPFCFNRKEPKDHGEGGIIIGAPLTGKVLILDDVITAGTAIRESITLIQEAGASPAGIIISLNRQERGSKSESMSTLQEIEEEYKLPIISLVNIQDIMSYLELSPEFNKNLQTIKKYQEKYGVF